MADVRTAYGSGFAGQGSTLGGFRGRCWRGLELDLRQVRCWVGDDSGFCIFRNDVKRLRDLRVRFCRGQQG